MWWDMFSGRKGAVALYVAVIIAVLLGLVGLALDIGRLYTTDSQAQAAADAAAIAAASQLNGKPNAIARAINAAKTTPLVQERSSFGEGDALIKIAGIRFLHSLPSDDQPIDNSYVTTDPALAKYVEVQTEDVVHRNVFLRALRLFGDSQVSGLAVGGYNHTLCPLPPLMICNPFETAGYKGFPAASNIGVQLRAHINEGLTVFAPGDIGSFDTSSFEGVREIAMQLAKIEPDQCYGTTVSVIPGSETIIETGTSTRFDQYLYPIFTGSDKYDPELRPGPDVIKGKVTTTFPCQPEDSPLAQALPRDTCLISGTCGTALPSRLGDGNWDRNLYWSVNHPDIPLPPQLVVATRYQTYRYEIDNHLIPDNSATGGEDGNPQCYAGAEPPLDDPDRRVLYIAIVNCLEQGPISGAVTDDVKVKTFAKWFLTEPVPGGGSVEALFELVGEVDPWTDDNSELHENVQLFR